MPQTAPGAPARVHATVVRDWIQASRPPFYIVTLVPVAAGLLLAARDGHFLPLPALITLLGALCLHAGTNFANDYYDYVQYEGDLPFRGGSGVIQEDKLTPETLNRAGWLMFALSAAAGIYLALLAGWPVLVFTALGLFGGVYYSAPPIRFGYRGLAELVCGLSMGPVIVLGTYYVQAGGLSPAAAAASFPLGSLVAFILYAESIHDIDEDRQTGKRTLASMLGERGALRTYVAWVTLTAAGIALLAAAGLLPGLLLADLVPLLAAAAYAAAFLRGGYEHARLYRLGRVALVLYLLTGLLLLLGL